MPFAHKGVVRQLQGYPMESHNFLMWLFIITCVVSSLCGVVSSLCLVVSSLCLVVTSLCLVVTSLCLFVTSFCLVVTSLCGLFIM